MDKSRERDILILEAGHIMAEIARVRLVFRVFFLTVFALGLGCVVATSPFVGESVDRYLTMVVQYLWLGGAGLVTFIWCANEYLSAFRLNRLLGLIKLGEGELDDADWREALTREWTDRYVKWRYIQRFEWIARLAAAWRLIEPIMMGVLACVPSVYFAGLAK